MKLSTMRRLDTLAGVPAVQTLKGWRALAGPRPRTVAPEAVRRVLVIKCFGMGSILLARPLFAAIRATFPNARLALLTFESNRSLVSLLPEIDELHTLDTRNAAAFGRSVSRALWSLNRGGVDLSFDLEFFSKFTTFCSLASGAPWRVGFYLQTGWREGAYTHNAYFNSTQHITRVFRSQLAYALAEPDQMHLELAEDLCQPPDPVPPPLRLPEVEHEKGEAAAEALGDGPRIAVNVNAGDLSFLRRWPLEHFRQLLAAILERHPEARLGLIGGPGDVEYVAELAEHFRDEPRVVNLAGKLSIPASLAFLGKVDLLIGNDSGPLHMAAEMGADTISFFGPETPLLYAPQGTGTHRVLYRGIFCSPCLNVYNNKLTMCQDNVCIWKIGVDQALGAVEEWFAGERRHSERARARPSEASARS